MTTPTTTTILIPCHQQAHQLPIALESALAQTATDVEIVIVNDGSTDATHDVARAYSASHPGRVKLIEHDRNRGVSMARASGLVATRGDFLVFLDADDQLAPHMVATCLRAFGGYPKAALVVGNAWTVGPDGRSDTRLLDQQWVPRWPAVIETNPFGVLVGVMMRTDAVRKVGGFGTDDLRACEDWDLWARMIRCHMQVVTVPQRLGWHRRQLASLGRSPVPMLDGRILLLDRCARDDDRLQDADVIPAPPIGARFYTQLRNSAVFHSLGLAAASMPSIELYNEITRRLVPGSLVPARCGRQFALGWWHGCDIPFSEPPAREIDIIIESVTLAFGRVGLVGRERVIRREIARAFHPRRDAIWLWRAVAHRARRISATSPTAARFAG